MIPSEWWQVWDCEGVLSEYWDTCDDDTRDEIWTSLQLLREYGVLCPSGVSEALGHQYGLLSLKARSITRKVHIRMIYFFFATVRRRIVIVDVIEKKKRALESADLKVALKRKAEIETGELDAAPFQRRPHFN
jgi:hypothetical protein